MNINQHIRSLIAGVLLGLFALAVTPRVAIHMLVANHVDKHLSLTDVDKEQLNKAEFHCAIDNLVVESPFIEHALSLKLGLEFSYVIHHPEDLEAPVSTLHSVYQLRGPPAAYLI